MPGVRPLEPFLAFNFAVEIEGLLVGGFSEVERPARARSQVEEYREGGVNGFVHKLPGPDDVTPTSCCATALTAVSTLWNWYDEHDPRRRSPAATARIMLLDRRHASR